jgi:hypothetical protein
LKAVREKKQIMYKGKPIKIIADFSTETVNQEELVVRYSSHRMKTNSTLGYSTLQNYYSK